MARPNYNTRRYRTILFRICLILCLNYIIFSLFPLHRSPSIKNVDIINSTSFELILRTIYPRSPHLNDIDVESNNYNELVDETSLYRFLQQNDFTSRCDLFFKQLYKTDPDWRIDPHRSFSYNRDIFRNFEDFATWKLEQWKKEQDKKKKEKSEQDKKLKEKSEQSTKDKREGESDAPSDSDLDELPPSLDIFREEFIKERSKVRHEEQILHEYFAHLRIFNKCYLTNDDRAQVTNDTTFIKKQHEMLAYINYQSDSRFPGSHEFPTPRSMEPTCNDLEAKLYPWLSFKYPVFERYDGKIVSFPHLEKRKAGGFFSTKKNIITDTIASSSSAKSSQVKSNCFLSAYRKQLNGKGIVLSVADMHLELTIRLIRLLRSLKNDLPIQIVYYDNLSSASKQQIVEASQSDFGRSPKQDVWFVNVNRSINKNYLNKFAGFGNKILATLFNSFEEIILIDADTVMLKGPEFFFQLEKYIKTGTVFYKDRSTFEFRPQQDLVFFKKMLPSLKDTIAFNIPQITSYTLENEFFQGLNHFMESGLVVMNRAKHFAQPLIMSQLNFHLPVQARVYGDKELFWLALAISGDENYSFNKHFAASIGELTPVSERIGDVKQEQTFKSQEICSNHPGHINDADNHTLLWFNSGFQHCGQLAKVNLEEEFGKKRRYTRAKSLQDFKDIFEGSLKITHAIIPPFDMKRLTAKNNEHEPERSWLNMRDYCSGYTWCAYSSMGGEYVDEDGKPINTQMNGITIDFTEGEMSQIDNLGEAWNSDYDYHVYVNDYDKADEIASRPSGSPEV